MAQIMLRDYLQETEDAISSERIDDALARCQQMLAQFPEALEAQRLLGEVYLAQGRLEDAQHAFDWVLTNDPENVIAYCNRALVSERKTDFDTALDCYQQAYELSRGNSHIRNEFNKLCMKVGQQGFMFSRAGLARLYMRGDLLTQAVQEWDMVLAVNPDRLDARTGLLETLWRDGLYDRTEQLAMQILQDVPGCLKALLLVAHTVSSQDMRQAQEFLQRAQALDPDLVMAQELFADMLAKQPEEPFLQLLKKLPTNLETVDKSVSDASSVQINAPSAYSQGPLDRLPEVYDMPTSMNAVPSWSESWGNEIALPTPQEVSPQGQSNIPVWSSNSSIFGADKQPEQELPDLSTSQPAINPSPWDSFGQSAESAATYEEPQFEQWQSPPQNDMAVPEHLPKESELWDKLDKLSSDLEGVDIWSSKEDSGQVEPATALWNDPAQQNDTPSPPVWLSMLTQGERRQLDGSMASLPPVDSPSAPISTSSPLPLLEEEAPANSHSFWQGEEASGLDSQLSWQDALQAANEDRTAFDSHTTWQDELGIGREAEKATFSSQPSWQDELQIEQSAIEEQKELSASASQKASPISDVQKGSSEKRKVEDSEDEQEEEDASFFGPAWLKSLGATLIDEDAVQEPSEPLASSMTPLPPVVEPSQAEREPVYYEVNPPLRAVHETQAELVYEPQAQTVAHTVSEQKELNLQMTLEELEQSLISQGFLPLAPNSLSSVAKIQEVGAANSMQAMQAQETAPESWIEHVPAVEAPFTKVNTSSLQATERDPEPTLSSALAELGSFAPPPTPPVQPPIVQATPLVQAQPSEPLRAAPLRTPVPQQDASVLETLSANEALPSPTFSFEPKKDLSQRFPAHRNVASTSTFEPSSSPATNQPREPLYNSTTSAARSNPLLDNELETTMKRPAVRLQAMQQRYAPVRDQGAVPHKGRLSERLPTGKAKDGSLSAQERLLKGYQYQLAGDYDESMREYRVIIKSSPELLSDIVSNVRALLKLAPNYAAGYRVLGDAYMRQGEYLQAMEAYNKALTMAKKARS